MTAASSESTAELLARFEAQLASAPRPGSKAVSPSSTIAPQIGRDDVTPARWSYREAAAVLERFRPAELQPVDPTLQVPCPHALLWDDIQPASGGRREQLYELRPEIRRTALKRLGGPTAMLGALGTNPGRWLGDSQELYESWLRGSPPPLAAQSYRELTIGREIRKWLDGLVEGLPSEEALNAALAERELLDSFEHLALSSFVGRAKELQRLREYVGVLPPSTEVDSLIRQLRSWFGLSRRAPLVIWAPGGTGKSALVGRFLLDHSTLPAGHRFPFAYLPLDNKALRVSEPFTLVTESAQQLRRQFPALAEQFNAFNAVIDGYRDNRDRIMLSRARKGGTRSGRIARTREADAALYRQFGELLHRLSQRASGNSEVSAPALLVIDTFEEAQYRDHEKLLGLWDMLAIVQSFHPSLRVVISGRAPVQAKIGGRSAEDMQLADLDPEAAVELLLLQGVSDETIARRIVDELGGNPLTLKLAARALRSDPELGTAAGLKKGIKTRRYGIFHLSPELIRGQLYTRILDHIHDPEVRKLAHPGMTLRRVTSGLILNVLAGPCGMDVPDEKKASSLFELLAREHAFVTREQDGSLRYRPEIRVPMLKLLKQNRPRETLQIHGAAVDYYSASSTIEGRGEEMYHRLALDQEPWKLDERWLPGCGDFLVDAVDELPPRAVAWLASRADLEVPRELFANADLDDWERNVTRKTLSLLRHQAATEALTLLGERAARSPLSPLFGIEAHAHWMLGNDKKALAALDRGLESSPPVANLGRVTELLWMKAETLLRLGDREEAVEALRVAEGIAENMPRPLCRFQLLIALVRALELGGGADRQAVGAARARLATVMNSLEQRDLLYDQSLTRAALPALGPDFPAAFRRGLATVGLGELDPQREEALQSRLAERLGDSAPTNPTQAALLSLERAPEDRELLGYLAGILAAEDYSLEGTNLAGIEDYREPWEIESGREMLLA